MSKLKAVITIAVILTCAIAAFFLYHPFPAHLSGTLAILANDGTSTNLETLDLNTGKVKLIASGLYEWPPPCWTGSGKQLIFGAKRGSPQHLFAVSPFDSLSARDLTKDLPLADDVTCDPVLENIAYISLSDRNGHQLNLMDLNTNQKRVLYSDAKSFVGYPVFSHDGKRIAFVSGTGRSGELQNLLVIEIDGGRSRIISQDIDMFDYPAWSPHDDWIAYNSEQKRIKIVQLQNGTSKTYNQLARPGKAIEWASGGKKIFYSGAWTKTQIYSLSFDDPSNSIYEGGDLTEAPALSKNNDLFFASTNRICFWNCGYSVYVKVYDDPKIYRLTKPYKSIFHLAASIL